MRVVIRFLDTLQKHLQLTNVAVLWQPHDLVIHYVADT